jgi:hypothetical protein
MLEIEVVTQRLPQEPASRDEYAQRLEIKRGKMHVLFGGTRLMQHVPDRECKLKRKRLRHFFFFFCLNVLY